jgi:hypothetical protein
VKRRPWNAASVGSVTVDARREASAASAMLSRAESTSTESSAIGDTRAFTKPTPHAVTESGWSVRRGQRSHSSVPSPDGAPRRPVSSAPPRPMSVTGSCRMLAESSCATASLSSAVGYSAIASSRPGPWMRSAGPAALFHPLATRRRSAESAVPDTAGAAESPRAGVGRRSHAASSRARATGATARQCRGTADEKRRNGMRGNLARREVPSIRT